MRPIDIRIYKTDIRERIKQSRRELKTEEKEKLDRFIASNVRRLFQYKYSDTLLCYVSTPIEVDTINIIQNAWKDGKRVAVPRCIPDTRLMDFHYITSFDQLNVGMFRVLEPDISLPIVNNFDKCLMLVPALAYDRRGYRLGYGKGYYDRYMSKFTGVTVGICYSSDVRYHLYHGKFDRSVDTVVTDKWIKKSQRQRRDRIN